MRHCLAVPFLLLSLAPAVLPKDLVAPVNADGKGVAIKGYDTVAYFTDSRPVNGSPEFTAVWRNATWRFASAANRDRFQANPEQYVPQYGGYCAWAVSNNYTAPIDPTAWRIVNGRLYLNYNSSVQARWAQELNQRIDAADRNWPSLHK
ncbi:MAG: YHS domain protein [Acidobacteria bacterium]|nr:YHS domain protein [Acidobacteriota bacterium]